MNNRGASDEEGDGGGAGLQPDSGSVFGAKASLLDLSNPPPFGLSARVADTLGRQIVVDLGLKGLSVPTEPELCREFGAGCTVVRQAVKTLIAYGLISVGPRKGTRVRREDEWLLLTPQVLGWLTTQDPYDDLLVEFLQLRLGVEPAAAALAARHATEADQAIIREALRDMEAEGGDGRGHLKTDIAFHDAILNATGNRLYVQLGAVTETSLELATRRAHALQLR